MKGIEELTVDLLEKLDLPGDFPVGFTMRDTTDTIAPPVVGYIYTDPQKGLIITVQTIAGDNEGRYLMPIPQGSIESGYVRALLRTVAEKLDIVRRKR